jgi:hypothetical protein
MSEVIQYAKSEITGNVFENHSDHVTCCPKTDVFSSKYAYSSFSSPCRLRREEYVIPVGGTREVSVEIFAQVWVEIELTEEDTTHNDNAQSPHMIDHSGISLRFTLFWRSIRLAKSMKSAEPNRPSRTISAIAIPWAVVLACASNTCGILLRHQMKRGK